jgi:phage terminase small subunit
VVRLEASVVRGTPGTSPCLRTLVRIAEVPKLERLRLLSRLDGVTLEALCTTDARWRRHDGGLGYAALTTVLGRLARHCSLAPAARQRMTAPASDRDELERSIFGTDP